MSWLSLSRKGLLAIGSESGDVALWDLASRMPVRTIRRRDHYLARHSSGAFDSTGDRILVRAFGATDTIDPTSGALATTEVKLGDPPPVSRVASFHTTAEGSRLATVESAAMELLPQLVVWPGGRETKAPLVVKLDGLPTSVAGADKVFAVAIDASVRGSGGGDDDDVHKKSRTHLALVDPLNAAKRTILQTFDEHFDVGAVSPDASLVALSMHSGQLVLFDTKTRVVRWKQPPPHDGAGGAGTFGLGAFAPDGSVLAMTSNGGVAVYDVASGRFTGAFGAHVRIPESLHFVTDTTLLVGSIAERWTSGPEHFSVWSLDEARVARAFERKKTRSFANVAGGEVVVASSEFDNRCGRGKTLVTIRRYGRTAPPMRKKRPATIASSLAAFPPPIEEDAFVCVPGLTAQTIDSAGRVVMSSLGGADAAARQARADLVVHDLVSGARVPLIDSVKDGAFFATRRWVVGFLGRVWDANTGVVAVADLLARAEPGARVLDARITDDESRIAVATSKAVHVIELPSGDVVSSVPLGGSTAALGIAGSSLVLAFANGTFGVIRDGKETARTPTDGGSLRSVAVSPGGDVAAAIADDGAVRIFDTATGRLRATLVEFADGEHIVFGPDGSYTGTAEVADRLGWQFDEPRETFRFEQFARLYEDDARVRSALAGRATVSSPVLARPPHVELGRPEVVGATAKVRVSVTSVTRVDAVRTYVEGRLVSAIAVCKQSGDVDVEVPLLPGKNRVTVVAFDDRGFASNKATFDATAPDSSHGPALWLLAAGVSTYPKLPPEQQLEAAAEDARAVARAFEGRDPFREVKATLLINEEVRAASVAKALDSMSEMQPGDVAIVFFAGHGVKMPGSGQTLLLTSDSAATAESLRATAIGWDLFADRFARMRGRIVLLLDACHSGHIDTNIVAPNDALARALASGGRAGTVVFAAAKGRQYSFEANTTRSTAGTDAKRAAALQTTGPHGFFTAAILKSLESASTDLDGDGSIQWSELVDAVKHRVTTATEGAQTPWQARAEVMGDFTIARAPHSGAQSPASPRSPPK